MGKKMPSHLVRSHNRKRAFASKREAMAEIRRLERTFAVRLTYYKCRVGVSRGVPGHYHLRNKTPRRYR